MRAPCDRITSVTMAYMIKFNTPFLLKIIKIKILASSTKKSKNSPYSYRPLFNLQKPEFLSFHNFFHFTQTEGMVFWVKHNGPVCGKL